MRLIVNADDFGLTENVSRGIIDGIKNGIITDTSIANIAIFYDGVWITSKNSLLNGTTKDRLIEEKKLIEKDISVDIKIVSSNMKTISCSFD